MGPRIRWSARQLTAAQERPTPLTTCYTSLILQTQTKQTGCILHAYAARPPLSSGAPPAAKLALYSMEVRRKLLLLELLPMHCKALESQRTSSSPHVLTEVVLGALLARIEVLNRRKHPGARRVPFHRTSHFQIPPPHDHCSQHAGSPSWTSAIQNLLRRLG